MRIAQISRFDWSCAGYALKQAFDAATNHKCRHLSMKRTWIKYPYDILAPTEKDIKKWLSWSDIWIVHDDGEELIPKGLKRKPTIKVYHGTYYRKNWKSINRQDKRKGNIQTCLTQDLSIFGPKWIGRVIPDLTGYRNKQDVFRVVQCPAKASKKGTSYVIEALQNMSGIDLDIVTRKPYKQCLIRKGRADVLIDQVGPKAFGYGTNALEAWAMGIPVISGCSKEVRDRIIDCVGYIPFFNIHDYTDSLENGIKEVVLALKNNQKLYGGWVRTGQEYIKDWHSAEYVTGAMIGLL